MDKSYSFHVCLSDCCIVLSVGSMGPIVCKSDDVGLMGPIV